MDQFLGGRPICPLTFGRFSAYGISGLMQTSTGIGMIIGLPMIFFVAILLFI
jgi:hypothetical protein